MESENLARKIKSMSKADIELLTMYIADGKTHAEIAKILGVDRTVITRRMEDKKLLEKIKKLAHFCLYSWPTT